MTENADNSTKSTSKTIVLRAVIGRFLVMMTVTANTFRASERPDIATNEAVSFAYEKPFRACFVQIDIKDIVDLLRTLVSEDVWEKNYVNFTNGRKEL